MSKETITKDVFQEEADHQSVLEKVLREGARRMLQQALENEIETTSRSILKLMRMTTVLLSETAIIHRERF